ncbi:OLC1v1015622C1 [Oldenlandia corymbosa var. corymbosa]|uniref:OLC1v1015622C1 n=1 Tax=Oldenlandia corymbosa var. corymbosa TaxID=529605 RepID=A0AAV1E3L8_OLDCO|nr:OLC1v1015622C1 [Oldenlandia corymbosa var. corymbosa]
MEVAKVEMPGDVTCLDIAPVPEGRQRSRFLAVGSFNNVISILSLDPDNCLEASVAGEDGADHPAYLFLNAGLQNGVLVRSVVDMVTGQVSDWRSRFLGLKPPKLFSISVRGRRAMICLSSRPWLGYVNQGQFQINPLSYENLQFAAAFSSLHCAEGVVAVSGDALRDQGGFGAEEREANKKECVEAESGNDAQQMEICGEEEENDPLSDEQYGYPKAKSDKWVSCIRVFDLITRQTSCLLELQDNEEAFSICTVNFHDKEYGTMLAVGRVKGLKYSPKRSFDAAYIHVCRLKEDGKVLELVHKTQVEGIPLRLCPFQGRLLAGIGPVLRLYDLGKKRLLRKSMWTLILRLELDKFGNIFFARLPQDVSQEIEEDPTGGRIKWEQGKLNGAPNKVEEIVRFHVGDVVSCMQKGSLIPSGREGIIYGTVMGSVGAMIPFTSRDDVDFFSHLEMHLRQEHPPLCGRDHMAYRSAYFPVKDVIDGDLCEQFPTLPLDMQRKIADELERTPAEIVKKLEELRSKII